MSIEELIAAIKVEAEKFFGDPAFEHTPEQYTWLAAKVGISAAEDVKWRFAIDPEADDKLDPETPDDEALIEFLSDEDALERFLTTLLQRYRAALDVAPRTAPERRPAPGHSEAFVRVRDTLIALRDDADRAALTRLFGAIGAPESDPSPAFAGLIRAIATLDDKDLLKLARWCRTYVTRSGQIPQAAGRPAPTASGP